MTSALLLILCCASTAVSQVAEQANRVYQTEEGRQALVRGLDRPDREAEQKPREFVQALAVRPGATVADIGTGTGFLIPYLLEAIGPEGKLYAEDIYEEFLKVVQRKKSERGWSNVEMVLGEPARARLPAKTMDLVLIHDAYHQFDYPIELMRDIRTSLRDDGRLVLSDLYRNRKHPFMARSELQEHIRKDKDGFVEEISSAGFELIKDFDHFPYQYVLIFRKSRL